MIKSSEAAGITQLDKGLPSPIAVSYDSETNTVYVASKRYNWVTPIRYESNGAMTIMPSLLVGETPVGINHINNRIYVTNWGSNTLSNLTGGG